MAMEIKAIPTLKEKEAEHFVKAADKAYKNQNKQDFSKHVLEARAVLKKAKMLKTWDFFLRNVLLPYLMSIRLKNVTLSHAGTKT